MGKVSLITIYEKNLNHNELSKEELEFLYDLKRENSIPLDSSYILILDEILETRNHREDIAKLHNLLSENIGFIPSDLYRYDIKVYVGNLDLSKLKEIDNLKLPEIIYGDLNLSGLESQKGLILPQEIYGNLDLKSISYLENLTFPKIITGNILLNNLETAKNIIFPKKMKGYISISNLLYANNVIFPKEIKSYISIRRLRDGKGITLPEKMNGRLYLDSLTKPNGLVLPKKCKYYSLKGLYNATGLIIPDEIEGILDLNELQTIEGLVLPKKIDGDLLIKRVDNLDKIVMPIVTGKIVTKSLKEESEEPIVKEIEIPNSERKLAYDMVEKKIIGYDYFNFFTYTKIPSEMDELCEYLCMDNETLKNKLYEYLCDLNLETISNKDYIYSKGDIPILLVAHMDTVLDEPLTKDMIKYNETHNFLIGQNGIGGDDRCGIYIIKKLLEQYKPYVLFTNQEENGRIGVKIALEKLEKPDVKYVVGYDAPGRNDCKFYNCGNGKFINYIESFGFKINTTRGLTDSIDLGRGWNLASVNLSAGYYNQHTRYEYIVYNYLLEVIEKSKRILEDSEKASYYNYQFAPYKKSRSLANKFDNFY